MHSMNIRPDLPEIFPQDEVTVEGEEHTFKVSELDSGTQKQYEYTLNKAPIAEIQSVQGIDEGGNSRTFSNGVDYELTSKTNTVSSTFTFDSGEQEYLLRYKVDTGTDSITDESGDTYVNGTDYAVNDTDEHYGDLIAWLDGGDSPENNEEFTVSYDVTFPSSVLQWQTDADNLPQADSIFYVTYRADSIISRYLDAHEEELNDVDEALQEVINNKFVDTASGEALDELGKLFGPTIGKRRGRDDVQYRIYLKSIVQSFVSRGTVNGIKLAISAATEVPLDDIVINENFEDVEYEVQVQAATPVTVELLEEVAEIADPSGVDQVRTSFITDPDEMVVQEALSITEGQQFIDDMAVADSTGIFNRSNFEDVTLDDATAVNPNKIDAGTDEMQVADAAASTRGSATDDMASADAFAIDPNKYTFSDDMAGDETVEIDPNLVTALDEMSGDEILHIEPSDKNAHRWEDDSSPDTTEWGFFEWTEIVELSESITETGGSAETVAIDPNTFSSSDDMAGDDTPAVDANKFTASDDASADDAATVDPNTVTTAEDSGSSDAVATDPQTVAWDAGDWETMSWAKAQSTVSTVTSGEYGGSSAGSDEYGG